LGDKSDTSFATEKSPVKVAELSLGGDNGVSSLMILASELVTCVSSVWTFSGASSVIFNQAKSNSFEGSLLAPRDVVI
jgi:hypothetical protein